MSETVPKTEQEQPAQLVDKVEQEAKAEGDGQEVAAPAESSEETAEDAQVVSCTS
jgi:hypothetical protein